MSRTAVALLLCSLLGLTIGKDVSRSKRQLSVYYMCGTGSNSYVSQYPCSTSTSSSYSNTNCGYSNCNTGTNCGYSNCNTGSNCGYSNCNTGYSSGYGSSAILPTSFYNPTSNCNTGCSNMNCNQYNGNYVNGQYVAYNYGSNQYNACASMCCGGSSSNSYNPYVQSGPVVGNIGLYGNYNPYSNNINGGYNPYTQTAPGPVIGNGVNGVYPGPTTTTGTIGGAMCGPGELSHGTCVNGGCSNGYQCVPGNLCCRCAVGASNGVCSTGAACPAGYTCAQNGYCCAASAYNGVKLTMCINGLCEDNYECGKGNLCYPMGK